MNLKTLTLLAAVCLTTTLPAQDTLLILSKQAHTLSIVDPASLKIIAKAPVGPDPHEVTVSDDSHTAYVSNYGGGAYNTLDVIDLSNQKSTSVDINPLGGPHGLAFAGGKVWFTSENAKAIARLDPPTQKVDLVLGTGLNHTHMIAVTPDQKRAISINANTVSIYTLEPAQGPGGPPPNGSGSAPGGPPPPPPGPARTAWVHTLIPVGEGSEGFDISPDGKQLWTSNSRAGTISIIDLASKKVVDTIAADVASANRLKFTPDGRYALISLLGAPDLVIVDTATHKVVQRVPIGHGAAGIQMEPNGNRAFIACTPDDYVVVLDLHTFKELGHIDAGPQPDGMAWTIRRP
jgi:YVTN family beta-propeller protein